MATIEERVKAVTARILKLDPDQIKPEHSFTVDLGAESVQSIELVAMFEEEFGIEMDEDAALSVETVDKAVEFIAEVCKEQGVDPVRNSTKGSEVEKGKISNGVDVEQ